MLCEIVLFVNAVFVVAIIFFLWRFRGAVHMALSMAQRLAQQQAAPPQTQWQVATSPPPEEAPPPSPPQDKDPARGAAEPAAKLRKRLVFAT